MTRQIERLVESSYRDLTPSDHVEETVMAALPAQKPRPYLTVAGTIAAVLLLGLAIAIGHNRGDSATQDSQLAGEGTSLKLAVVAHPKSGVVPQADTDFRVRLVAGSGIRVLGDATWIAVNLDELGTRLAELPAHTRVVLTVDRDAPWQHVQWLMIICAERHLPNVAFAVKSESGETYYLDATLPTDPGIGGKRPKRVRVSVVPTAERDARWGEQAARIPTKVKYRLGKDESDKLDVVVLGLVSVLLDTPGATGEIQAMHSVRFETVARLMSEFRRAGVRRVDFYGTTMPDATTRKAAALPYPRSKPKRPGRSLDFALVEGKTDDLDRTVDIVRDRLAHIGLDPSTFSVEVTKQGIRVGPPAGADLDLVRRVVERPGVSLEFHVTVERDDPEYAREWKLRQKGEEPSKGFRWYELSDDAKKRYAKTRLPDGQQPLVLCRTDDYKITEASVRDARAEVRPWLDPAPWSVSFRVRESHQQRLADLTRRRDGDSYLAMIVDGKIHSSPRLVQQLRTTAQISYGFSRSEAKSLAALLQSHKLPVRLKVARR